jgi:DAACS family dicarboxylate/amino acid:cation (Na+ or H+) symporter
MADASNADTRLPREPRRRIALHTKILLGLIIGAAVGTTLNATMRVPAAGPNVQAADDRGAVVSDRLKFWAERVADPLGRVFLRMVLMVVLPLVFSALVLGVLGLGDLSRLGRVGAISLLLTLLLSGTSVGIGLGLVNSIRPGDGLSVEKRASLIQAYKTEADVTVARAAEAKPLERILLDLLPENPVQEAAGAVDGSSKGNGMLAIMFFALIFGAALAVIDESRRAVMVTLLEGLFDVSMVVIGWAMRIAPFAVACLMFSITARMGVGILYTLLWFVLTVLLGLGLQMFVVYSLALKFIGGRSPLQFFRDVRVAIVTAFGTSSSNATLPTALRVAQENLRLPPEIARFVLTVGSTANQNGTALYEGVVVLFLAQVFGVELTLTQQFTVVLMSILAGVGTAGVPGGSIPLIVVVCQTVGVPGEGIALILGVDRILDMCRTTLNVTGDLTLATCVAATEKQLEREAKRRRVAARR